MVEVSQKLVKEYFEYRDGHLYRLKKTGNNSKVGAKFGSKHRTGYITGWFLSKNVSEHRLVWLYFNSTLPEFVDHINGVRDDNRIENLREATRQQNSINSKSWGRSSYKGVSWNNWHKKWSAQIVLNGLKTNLGYFETEESAALAYDKVSKTDNNAEYRKLNYG